MNRLLAVMTVGMISGVAVADLPPPPPPKGKKYVSVNNEVVLDKDVSGYVFVQQVGTGPGAPKFTSTKLELTAGKAVAMPKGGKYTYVTLFAVPEDAVKEFKTDKDLFDALRANKVKGAHGIGFVGTATVSDTVVGNSVKWTHTIAADAKNGIKTTVEGEGAEPPAGKSGKDSPEDDPDEPSATARTPRGGVWVAGIAAFAAVTLGGVWLLGRSRRKVSSRAAVARRASPA